MKGQQSALSSPHATSLGELSVTRVVDAHASASESTLCFRIRVGTHVIGDEREPIFSSDSLYRDDPTRIGEF